MQGSLYQQFAGIYDTLMDDVNYFAWADFYVELMARTGLLPQKICEAGCGTGGMTLPLARKGFAITALDRSQDMLQIAAQKARKAGAQVIFSAQDMRTFSLHNPVDAVLCACDGVNYLTTPKAVKEFFCAANRALSTGGGLFFDISSAYKLEYVLGNSFYGESRESIAYLWQNTYDSEHHRVRMDLTFFEKRPDGAYARFEETHIQRAHTMDEIALWLGQCGFELKLVTGDQTFLPPLQEEKRLHFAAIKCK